jgi:DNA modification methylase
MARRKGRFMGQDLLKGENPNFHQRSTPTGANGAGRDPGQGGDIEGTGAGPASEAEGGGGLSTASDIDVAAPQKTVPFSGRANEHDDDGNTGTSIFDPVLCELAYRWFSPSGGRVLDPFAGGSVRGIVAWQLGLAYLGIELRMEQIRANLEQIGAIADRSAPRENPAPLFYQGDAYERLGEFPEGFADLIFTCPPYGDLETYSDHPMDISGWSMDRFDDHMRLIILRASRALKDDRFSIWVCSDYRGKDGAYARFPSKLREWHAAAGLKTYNEAILINSVGSLPIRAGKQFNATRKLGRCHQEMLIFLKGDERKATAAMAPIDMRAIDEALRAAGL